MKAYELALLPPKPLIYSRPGLGKTALALTLGPTCLYYDLDDNMEVAFGLRDQFRDERLNVEVEQFIDRDPHKATAFTEFNRQVLAVAKACVQGNFEYEYLVVDSLTSLSVACMHNVLASERKIGTNPEIQHWGKRDTALFRVVSILRTLPIPVFMLAHEMIEDTGGTQVVKIAVEGKKLPPKIVRMFNEIWYLRAKPAGAGVTELFLQTVPTTSITCRSGRGLTTGTRYATILKDGSPQNSVGLKELLDRIIREEVKPTDALVKTK